MHRKVTADRRSGAQAKARQETVDRGGKEEEKMTTTDCKESTHNPIQCSTQYPVHPLLIKGPGLAIIIMARWG